MEIKSVKDALIYANTMIKNGVNVYQCSSNEQVVNDILKHTTDYVKTQAFCDQKVIQSLLNSVYKYYNTIEKIAIECSDETFLDAIRPKHVVIRNSFKGSLLENYAYRLLLDVTNYVICKNYA